MENVTSRTEERITYAVLEVVFKDRTGNPHTQSRARWNADGSWSVDWDGIRYWASKTDEEILGPENAISHTVTLGGRRVPWEYQIIRALVTAKDHGVLWETPFEASYSPAETFPTPPPYNTVEAGE